MTPTLTLIDPATAAGMTRAAMLELLRGAGVPATAWNRARMAAVLTGEEERPGQNGGPPSAARLTSHPARRPSEEGDALVAKVRAKLAQRTGRCLSVTCEIGCQAYEEGARDAFHWQLCTCGHTQWTHSKTQPALGNGEPA